MRNLLVIFLLLLSISCAKEGVKSSIDLNCEVNPQNQVTFNEGNHISDSPNLFDGFGVPNVFYIGYRFHFDENSLYQFPEDYCDEGDWNKLGGFTFPNCYSPNGLCIACSAHKNTVMPVGRFYKGIAQMSYYFHDDDCNRYHGAFPSNLYPDIPLIELQMNKCYYVMFKLDKNQKYLRMITYRVEENVLVYEGQFEIENYTNNQYFGTSFDFDFNNARQISPYFGGDAPAPNDVSYNKENLSTNFVEQLWEQTYNIDDNF